MHAYEKEKVLVAQSCPILCDSMDCSPSGSSVLGILQARILEWVAMPFWSFLTQGSNLCLMSPALADRFFNTSTTCEAAQVFKCTI